MKGMRECARPLLSIGKASADPGFAFKTLRGNCCHVAPSLIEQPSLITNPVNLSQNERAQRHRVADVRPGSKAVHPQPRNRTLPANSLAPDQRG